MEIEYAQSDNDGCSCGLYCRPAVRLGRRTEAAYYAILGGEDWLFSIVRVVPKIWPPDKLAWLVRTNRQPLSLADVLYIARMCEDTNYQHPLWHQYDIHESMRNPWTMTYIGHVFFL